VAHEHHGVEGFEADVDDPVADPLEKLVERAAANARSTSSSSRVISGRAM
jgi:hypothetical protein